MDDRSTAAEIESLVRDLYRSKLEGGEGLHAIVEDAFHSWSGSSVDSESVDPIIVAEGARATKTFGGVLRLVSGGFGPQASMLDRSLFEGMAVAHWAHANPERAVELFKKHGRHGELLWGDAIENAALGEPRTIDIGTTEERKELGALFGKYGTKLWTGHGSLYELLPDIEGQWDEQARKDLWSFYGIAQRDNNQVLHSTALGLSAGVTARTSEELGLDVGPSDHYLDRGLLGGLWSFGQLATLLWDHFDIPDRKALDGRFKTAWEAFTKHGCDAGDTDGQ